MAVHMRAVLSPELGHVLANNEKHDYSITEIPVESSSEDEETDLRPLPGHIISSPYIDVAHQLDLTSLDSEYGDFAQALTEMKATRVDYATAPYAESFNWDGVAQAYVRLHASPTPARVSFFVIVFRSRLKQDADRQLLGQLDKEAHLEAVDAGGLLKYWFGSPDHNRRNLATCLWRARDDARIGGAGPGHAAAMTAARKMYDEWFVERLRLTVNLESASWSFEQWVDSE